LLSHPRVRCRTLTPPRRRTGLTIGTADGTIDTADPTASFLRAGDYVMSGLRSEAEHDALERKFSAAYVACTRSYFAALAAQLRPVKARLVERNRELLERYEGDAAPALRPRVGLRYVADVLRVVQTLTADDCAVDHGREKHDPAVVARVHVDKSARAGVPVPRLSRYQPRR